MKNFKTFPMNLQLFAEAGAPAEAQEQQPQEAPQIDYGKIQQMLDGTLAAKEDTALKAYFKQQGLSQQEAEQAMAAFKAEKAKNAPDVGALQTQLSQANALALQTAMENHALLMAGELGVNMKTMPYLIRMADLSGCTADGKVSDEKLKAALNKVLADLPQLKNQADGQNGGFKIGADTGSATNKADDSKLRAAFGLK